MTDLDISQIWIGHWPKPSSGASLPELSGLAEQALVLDTCLRQMAVTNSPEVAALAQTYHPQESLAGATAYRFLLEVVTGLRSAVPGETNVFGQFKRAWGDFREAGSAAAVASLTPFVLRAIRDTRDIRRDHLQNIGGASYGTLVRRLMRPEPGERILIVGAGELARAIVPFFDCFEIGVWNRRMPSHPFDRVARIFAPEDGAAAAGWARHVVMTTPADDANDERWRQWLNDSAASTIIHLGRRRGAPLQWQPPLRVYDLDDVFELRHAQANIRSMQLERARLACNDFTERLLAEPGSRVETLRAAAK